jgi:integration host factor subunit alpha
MEVFSKTRFSSKCIVSQRSPSMTLTKSKIIDAIVHKNGLTSKRSTVTAETIIELIKSSLESGEDVLIRGVGEFCVKEKRKQIGINPAIRND